MDYRPTEVYQSPTNPEEINATSAPLQSAAFALGEYCRSASDAYMLCKKDASDPSACTSQGTKVTQCAFDLYQHSFFLLMRHVFNV